MLTLRALSLLLIAATLSFDSSAFVPASSHANLSPTATQLNIFGKAFANEDLGPKKNAGLKKDPKAADVTVNGKPVPKAVAGQGVRQVMNAARVKMTYSCAKGNCGTCGEFVVGSTTFSCHRKLLISLPGKNC